MSGHIGCQEGAVIIFAGIAEILTDARFDANLIACYGVIVVLVLVALSLRRMLARDRPASTGMQWLDTLGDEATAHARKLLWWGSLAAIILLTLAGLGYHFAGRDVRHDLGAFVGKLSPETLLHLSVQLAECAGLLIAAIAVTWLLRRTRPLLQAYVRSVLGPLVPKRREAVVIAGKVSEAEEALRRLKLSMEAPAEKEEEPGEDPLEHWFVLLERFGVAAVRLGALWQACRVVGLGDLADVTVGFVLHVGTILVVARLLILAARVLNRVGLALGDQHLGRGPVRHYWERLHNLIPLGERCFEWSVYIAAGALCLRQIPSLAGIASYGPLIVHCIGIFFATRVAIEMVQVSLNEAFGLYADSGKIDPKGRTLVPLLHSCCQYVLYFGASVMMLGHLGMNIQPILAGAGILGLAVGLGAQSLVSDVVSGFFILFEGQYLVGDYVQIGDANGIVEEVGIRNTKVRDAQGKLFIIPNGQVKSVVSYSKGFINAVVDVKVPAGSDLEGVFRAMNEAGRRLKIMHHEVLAETDVQGLVDLGNTDMTLRAITKVQPGRHAAMQNEYRRILKMVFDEDKLQLSRAA
jgi:small conductance mechanosensitive channel